MADFKTVAGAGVCAVAFGLGGIVSAETLTWVCPEQNGVFSLAANWQNASGQNLAPSPGDTLKITKTTYFQPETNDFGAAGYTFEITEGKILTNHVAFVGSGRVNVNGKGTWAQSILTQHTGGWWLTNNKTMWGQRYVVDGVSSSGSIGQAFGTGTVVLDGLGKNNPQFSRGQWGHAPVNDFVITNLPALTTSGTSTHLAWGQQGDPTGIVTGYCDFRISQSTGVTVLPDVRAHGHTIYVLPSTSTARYAYLGFQKVDASIYVRTSSSNGSGTCEIQDVNVIPDNNLTIERGSNVVTSAGYWGGTNILLKTEKAYLYLKGKQNLAPNATVSVTAGRIDLGKDCSCRIASLVTNGVALADGVYTAENLPDVLQGTGSLIVRAVSGACQVWVGPASNSWNEASNWSLGRVPGAGDVVVFTKEVKLAPERVWIDEGVLTIINDYTLGCQCAFVGPGGIDKLGSGTLTVYGAGADVGGNTFSGGFRIEGGTLALDNRYKLYGSSASGKGYLYFGSGRVTVDTSTGNQPNIYVQEWDSGLTNAIDIVGGKMDGAYVISSGQNSASQFSAITSDCDFEIREKYAALHIGSVSAPGHTMSLNPTETYHGTKNVYLTRIYLEKPVDANIHKIGLGQVQLTAVSTNPASAFQIDGGTNIVTATGRWAGTNIVMSAEGVSGEGFPMYACLQLNHNDNLSENAVLKVGSNSTIDIAKGVKAHVAELFVNGEPKPAGVYRADSLPGVLTGEGTLRVGEPGLVLSLR